MGLVVEKNHGKEYLYVFAGMDQFFLGQKDDLDCIKTKKIYTRFFR